MSDRARQWKWILSFNAQHPHMTLAQVTGCAVDAGVLTAAERAALIRQAA